MQRRQFLAGLAAAGGALALPVAASAVVVPGTPVPYGFPDITELQWERLFWDEATQRFISEAEYNAIEPLTYNGIVWC
jgi:hypothetical protein